MIYDINSKPTYTGIFVLNGPDELGPLQFEVQYSVDEETKTVACISKRWVRLNYGTTALHKLLDVCLVDLRQYGHLSRMY